MRKRTKRHDVAALARAVSSCWAESHRVGAPCANIRKIRENPGQGVGPEARLFPAAPPGICHVSWRRRGVVRACEVTRGTFGPVLFHAGSDMVKKN
nr:hypothetical protein RVX_1404 [Nitratidesulfovibrio sp. HK-II]